MPSYAAPGVSDRKHGFFDIYLNSLIHQSHEYDILYAHSTLASITAETSSYFTSCHDKML